MEKISKGESYNFLTYTGNKIIENGICKYEFECVCGSKKYWKNLTVIRNGRIKSCGCKRVADLSNLRGQIFHYLTATGNYETNNEKTYIEVLCICGKKYYARYDSIKKGVVKSCGCKLKELVIASQTTHGCAAKENRHPLYSVWHGIRSRCANENHQSYKYYGAKGIKICDEWNNSFVVFYNWCIKNGWQKGLTVERNNYKGNYEPSNCKIATYAEQSRNKSDNINIIAFGETKCLMDWFNDERCVVSYMGLKDRIIKWKWDAEKAITFPALNNGNRTGKKKLVQE